jgi:eukaryotic-like serine/threonine-protein kinase
VDANECLPDDTVLAFVQGRLDGPAASEVEGHCARCAPCRRVLADTAQFFFDENAASAQPAVGRYQLLGLIGAGGAGAVYRAHDPQLARQVALKIVQPDRAAVSSEALIREAQAMARLSHPNVVTVFDAGTFAGGVFVVMELVEGTTLASWLRAQTRSWQDVLGVLVEAGAGLAAAHAAGLAHGDFKPHNVLIGESGRARVTDFGLATAIRGMQQAAGSAEVARVAGTPLFMAPEQFAGGQADAGTDQYGFCVTAWSALYGEHPYLAGRSRPSLSAVAVAARAGPLRRPPRSSAVPGPVAAALQRGLASRPEDRYPNMDALLAAVAEAAGRRVKGRRRLPGRRWVVAGALAAAAIASFVAVRDRELMPTGAIGAPAPPAVAAAATAVPVAAGAVVSAQPPPASDRSPQPRAGHAPGRARRPVDRVLRQAEALMLAGEVARACSLVARAAAVPGRSVAGAHRFLGRCHVRLGDHEAAHRHYRRYLELAPGAPDAVFIRGILETAR